MTDEGRSVDSKKVGREDSAPKSFVVADAEAISLAEGSIWTTVSARSLGDAGVPSPGHAFTRILQELGNTSQSPPAQVGCGSPEKKGPGLGRYGCTGKRSE